MIQNENYHRSRGGNESFRVRNNSFHSEFILFRKTLGLKKILRKTRIDSLLKKCKSKVFRTVQEAINLLTGQSNGKDNRLPQSFITNINIEYNKKYLNKTIEDIYVESKIFSSADGLIDSLPVNKMTEEDMTYLKILLRMNYRNIFESYIKSTRYISDYHYIKQREGEKYAILFDYVARIYVRYFLNGRGNKKRNPRKNKHNYVYKYIMNDEKKNGEDKNIIKKMDFGMDIFDSSKNLEDKDTLPGRIKLKTLKFRKKLVFKTY
jgi:hypothetical protein